MKSVERNEATEREERTTAAIEHHEHQHRRRTHWIWPLGIAAAGIGAAATVLLRGCWHNNMSWPVRAEDEHGDYSYQVCMNCGVKRLFDERTFRAFGPYDYDLHELIARERLERRRRMEHAALSKPVPPPEKIYPRAEGE